MRIAIIALCLCCCTAVQALDVGDKAPELDGTTWVRDPIIDGQYDFVVVEFWATWCAPCRHSIPHLTKLQQQYPGTVVIVGLSNEGEDVVRPFVEEMGDNMAYGVGIASPAIYEAYMADVPSIPHAYLVDKQAKVIWQGHPLEMDDVLAAAIRNRQPTTTPEPEPEPVDETDAAYQALEAAQASNDGDRIEAAAKRVLAIDPWDANAIRARLDVARRTNDLEAHRAILSNLDIGSAPARVANTLAWNLIIDDDLEWRQIDLAYALAKRAVAAAPDQGFIVDTLARCQYALGDIDGAIKSQQRAVDLSPDRDGLRKTLAYYQQVRTIRMVLRN